MTLIEKREAQIKELRQQLKDFDESLLNAAKTGRNDIVPVLLEARNRIALKIKEL